MRKISSSTVRKIFSFICVLSCAASLSGCMPGAGNVQGEQLPFIKEYWSVKYSMRYVITEKKRNAKAGELRVSSEPIGKDKINISFNLKNGDDTADIGALLNRETLMPIAVTKEMVVAGRKLKLQSEYQGRSLRVSLKKKKKEKILFFEVPSKVYYDNDIFPVLLQSLDVEALKKILDEKKKDKDKIYLALANPQIGLVTDAVMHISWKTRNLLISGKEISCFYVEIRHGKKLIHRAWYEEKLPHRLLKYESPEEIYTLLSFYKQKPEKKS